MTKNHRVSGPIVAVIVDMQGRPNFLVANGVKNDAPTVIILPRHFYVKMSIEVRKTFVEAVLTRPNQNPFFGRNLVWSTLVSQRGGAKDSAGAITGSWRNKRRFMVVAIRVFLSLPNVQSVFSLITNDLATGNFFP